MPNPSHWLALTELPEIGPATCRKLLALYKTPQNIFNASYKELAGVKVLGAGKAKTIKNFSGWHDVENRVSRLTGRGINLITFDDAQYPLMLRELPDPPLLLYTKGDIVNEDRYAIGIVGSRKPTSYGRYAAEKFSSELSALGFTIVSGMARGIDTLAHVSALKNGGRSIAVLGTGIDVPYPPENKGLMEKISSSGFVMSEFEPGTGPNRENFPRRNRLISGISLGVLVIEATADSGSLITAGCASEQGREVFAVPGTINSKNSEGTNGLIQKGAKLVLKTDDIIEELAGVLKGFLKSGKKKKADLTDEEKKICDMLTGEPKHVDVISREGKIPLPKVLDILLGLELKEVVRQAEGKRFYLG